MHRLLVDQATLAVSAPILPKEAQHHLKVLRPRDGEAVELFDGAGHTRAYHWQAARTSLGAPEAMRTSPPIAPALTLFACVTKGSRWDWTIEKAVELGVTRIVPVISERAIVRLASNERAAKAERWRRIAEDAARQSDAVWLPEIVPAVDFADSLPLVKAMDAVFVGALTAPPPPPLLTAIEGALDKNQQPPGAAPSALGLYVGPEGDFSPAELKSLLKIAVPTSFGPTILRAETAAIYGLSVLAAVCRR